MLTCEPVERRAAGRPTKAEAAAIDGRLMESAREAFCRQGIAGASMDEIAAAARVTKHTVYRRFASKLALLDAVVEQDIGRFHASLGHHECGGGQPLHALKHTAYRFFEYGVEPGNLCFFTFLLAESAFSLEMREKLHRWSEIATAPLLECVVAAQSAGVVCDAPAQEVCDVLIDLIDGAAERLRWGAWRTLDPKAAERFFEARWTLFLRLYGVTD